VKAENGFMNVMMTTADIDVRANHRLRRVEIPMTSVSNILEWVMCKSDRQ
jgi:hypothetical protein